MPVLWWRTVPLAWDGSRRNWGDNLSPFLVHKLTGRTPYLPLFRKAAKYVVIGSLLGGWSAKGLIWGAGFISSDSVPNGRPKKIYAVRGPLSRDIFVKHGILCPPVFGDPAILLGSVVPVARRTEYRFGVIPHYVDKNHPWIQNQLEKHLRSALLIDIEDEILDFINQVNRCEFIFSSSLHGLIAADTYKIPNTRIVLSDRIVGGDFKFFDYRLGIGAEPHHPARPVEQELGFEDLTKLASLGDVDDAANKLLAASPFRSRRTCSG